MATHIIKVPDIGEGIAEVELVAWHVKPGDIVAEDQALADVMTDKATVEVPSPVVGKVLSLGGEVGQVLAVGADLIRIETAGDGAGALARAPAAPAPQTKAVTATAQPAPKRTPAAPTAAPAASTRVAEPAGDRPIASPAVRRRAWELGLDLKQVAATGAGGRIMQADLDAHVAAHGVGLPPRPPTAAAPTVPGEDQEERVPVVGMRRRIALKMQESKRRIPHYTYVEEIDVTELEALRARLNTKWGEQRGRLTLLPLLVRALVLAARDYPHVNARFDDETGVITRHSAVHIGIATQTAAGLMVPVLRHAQDRDPWSCAAEVTRLAEAARLGKATRDELTGSTITITSLGALGGIATTPVINHPEVAIVGVNRIVERPMLRGGAVVARLMMNLSSSFDHRVVDGQYAAQFVQSMRGLLECPAMLFIDG